MGTREKRAFELELIFALLFTECRLMFLGESFSLRRTLLWLRSESDWASWSVLCLRVVLMRCSTGAGASLASLCPERVIAATVRSCSGCHSLRRLDETLRAESLRSSRTRRLLHRMSAGKACDSVLPIVSPPPQQRRFQRLHHKAFPASPQLNVLCIVRIRTENSQA